MMIKKTLYVKPDETIEIIENGMVVYNYQGVHFRIFTNFKNFKAWWRTNNPAFITDEAENEEELKAKLKTIDKWNKKSIKQVNYIEFLTFNGKFYENKKNKNISMIEWVSTRLTALDEYYKISPKNLTIYTQFSEKLNYENAITIDILLNLITEIGFILSEIGKELNIKEKIIDNIIYYLDSMENRGYGVFLLSEFLNATKLNEILMNDTSDVEDFKPIRIKRKIKKFFKSPEFGRYLNKARMQKKY